MNLDPIIRAVQAALVLALLALPLLLLGGCAELAQYDRTYSATYSDAQGRSIGTSVRLAPKPGGLAK